MSVLAKWDTGDYQHIVGAKYHGDRIVVYFADGSDVSIAAKRLLPTSAHGVHREALTFDAYEIVVPTADEPIEIPWSAIRALTDRQYAAHLASAAKEQARHVGLRIKELREQRGLTSKELAERSGITPQSMSRIENGHHDVVYTTLQQILAAMGGSLNDLMTPPSEGEYRSREQPTGSLANSGK